MSISSISPSNGVVGILRGLDEGIEVDDDQIDQRDAVTRDAARDRPAAIAAREDAAVDERVQRLDAAVHHLGKPGDVRNADDRQGPPARASRRCRRSIRARNRGRPSPRANSTRPDLSETLNSALGMAICASCGNIGT